MNNETPGALHALAQRVAQDNHSTLKRWTDVEAKWDGEDLVIRIPKQELNQAGPSNLSQERGDGFGLRVNYEYMQVPCTLEAKWVAMKGRKR